MKNIAAIYMRLSKEDISEGEQISGSIKNQRSMLTAYAQKNGWEIYDYYCDEDYSGAYSGSENTRPDFNRMIDDAAAGRFNIVLCKSQSRFSRSMEVVERYIHGRFTEWGIRFVGLTDNADTLDMSNKKTRQINSLVNEWYVEDLSENIRSVLRHKMKQGEYLAAFAPYGYMKENKNHLIINPETAPVVRLIFESRGQGMGAVRISRMLNEMRLPCPRKQQEIDGKRKTLMYMPSDLGQWSAATVTDILHNRVYCGDVVQHKVEKVSYKSKKRSRTDESEWIIVCGTHEPIISRELFDKIQADMKSGKRTRQSQDAHILAGKVFCFYCKKPMQKNSGGGGREYLRCRDRYAFAAKDRCPTPNIRLDKILCAIEWEYIKSQFESINKQPENDEPQNETDALSRRRLEKLYLDRLDGIITAEEYLTWKRRLTKAPKITPTRKLTYHDVVGALIDRIEFGEQDADGNTRLKIYWKI